MPSSSPKFPSVAGARWRRWVNWPPIYAPKKLASLPAPISSSMADGRPSKRSRNKVRERILITGPGGRVGTHLVPLMREHFALRLLDLKPVKAEGDDEVLQGDIRNLELLKRACDGAKVLIHLAAIPDEDEFYGKLLPFNLEGVYTAFEAA